MGGKYYRVPTGPLGEEGETKSRQDPLKTPQRRPKSLPRGAKDPSKRSFVTLLGRCGIILESFVARFGIRFVDAIHRFDFWMRFVDSSRPFSEVLFHMYL